MERPFHPVRTSGDADLAFAVVVLAAYFTTFSVMETTSTTQLLWMIALGVWYIAIGIYGYAYAVHSGKFIYHIAYFTVQLLLAGTIIFLSKGVGYNAMVLLPLAGHSVVLLPRSLQLPVNTAVILTYVAAMFVSLGDLGAVWAGLPIFLAGQIFIVVFTQMAVSEEKARAEVEGLVKELEHANQSLRAYAAQIEELAITQERNRLAREIHDGLGHYLTTIYMQIQAARAVMKSDSSKAMEALGRAQNQAQEALVDVRRSVAALRDLPSDSYSLQEEIEKMLKSCEGAGVSAELKVHGAPRSLTPQAVLAVYRAAQEGINNTVKHAGARRISVSIDYSQSDQVRMVVQDDGHGAERPSGGFGLMGIRERVQMLNGQVNVTTAPGDGFRLEVCIPG
jgi:signal transduction histidine kinase